MKQPRLTKAEAEVLDAYTEGAYRDINKTLRGIPTDATTVKNVDYTKDIPIDDAVAGMDRAFEKAPPLKESLVTYRGGQFPSDVPVGAEFTDNGFVSTGATPFTAAYSFWAANGKKGVVMEIVVPKGTKAIVPDMALKRDREQWIEGEVLLPRGSRFRVANRGEYEYPAIGKVPFVTLEVVP